MKRLMLAAIAALAFAPAASAMGTAGVVLDPQCLSEAAWAVDPASGPIRIFGCRPVSEIPAPDAEGWINYTKPMVDGADGGFTRVKMINTIEPNIIVFQVQDNGGGSGTMSSTVTGVPGPGGLMEEQGLKVE